MTKLEVIDKMTFKEPITSAELVDIEGDEKMRILISTLNGDVRLLEYVDGEKKPLFEMCRTDGLPPLAAVGVGDVLGNDVPELVIGGLDNALRVVAYLDGKLTVNAVTPLGSLPTAIGVFNVIEDKGSEVIVATTDGTLRCYGWYDIALDKLAHKVLEKPVFSIVPMVNEGMPFSRFVFGDETGHLYFYQYADDRLHERKKIKVGGEVGLVAAGDMTGNGFSEVISVSDGRNIAVFGTIKGSLESLDSVRAPKGVTSIKIGRFWDFDTPRGQMVSSHTNSQLTLLSMVGKRIIEEASLKTVRKSSESMVSVGDVTGDSKNEIVQAVRNTLHIIDVAEE